MAKKQKVKIVYKNKPIPKVKDENYESKVKQEIEELEGKRANVGKGFGGFLRGLSLNKAISDKKKIFNQRDKIKVIQGQTELGKAMLEREKVKTELKELKQKSQVNFDSLYKGSSFYS